MLKNSTKHAEPLFIALIDILEVDLNSVTLKIPNAKFEVISSKDIGRVKI